MSLPNGRHSKRLEDRTAPSHSSGCSCVLSLPKATAHFPCPFRPGMMVASCCGQSLGARNLSQHTLELNPLKVTLAPAGTVPETGGRCFIQTGTDTSRTAGMWETMGIRELTGSQPALGPHWRALLEKEPLPAPHGY